MGDGRGGGLDLGAVEACYLLALASMFAMIPSGPGYAGTMDAAVIFGARVLDRTPAAALSYLLLLRFVLFVPITLVGLAPAGRALRRLGDAPVPRPAT